MRFLLTLLALNYGAAANAGSVSPWVIDDPTDVASESRVKLMTSAFAATDFAPVIHFSREAINPDNPPKAGPNRAFGIGQAGVYFDYLGFQVGAFRRMDGFGTANSDAITALQALNSKGNLDIGRTYLGSYSYQLIDLEGVRLGKSFALPLPASSGWSGAFGVSFSPLHGVRIKSDSVLASLISSAPNTYSLSGQRIEADSRVKASDYNAFLPNGRPSADGYTSDFGLSLQSANGARVYLISDLASTLRWHAVPARTYSVQGFTGVLGTPLPAGFATTAPFSTELTRKTTVGMAYPFQSFAVEGAMTHLDGLNDPTLAVGHDLAQGWSAQLSVHPYWRALGLQISHPVFGRLRIVSDSASINRARALGIAYEAGFAF